MSSRGAGEEAVPSPELSRRLIQAERDCYVAWAEALASSDGNAMRASVHAFGDARVIRCTGAPARIVNRALALTAAEAGLVPAVCALFDEAQLPPCVELDPFAEYGADDALLSALARAGLAQSGFHQMLYRALPTGAPPELPDPQGIRIVRAASGDAGAFSYIHEQVWGDGRLITPLLNHPEFHCWIAWENELPVALGVLHLRDRTASLANAITIPSHRSRGIQLALLGRRTRAAIDMGCELLVSQASPRNVSLRNQVRAGLLVAGTKAIWTRSPRI